MGMLTSRKAYTICKAICPTVCRLDLEPLPSAAHSGTHYIRVFILNLKLEVNVSKEKLRRKTEQKNNGCVDRNLEAKGQAIQSGHLARAGFPKGRDTHGDVTVDHLPFLKGRQDIDTVSPLDHHYGLCHLMVPCLQHQNILSSILRC